MIFLKVLAWGIISVLVTIGVIFLAGEIGRKMDIDDDDVTLTFDEFYQMYCIDPSKWELLYFAGNYFARYEVNFPVMNRYISKGLKIITVLKNSY